MAGYTPNYGLHQWVPEDDFLRTDFNQDFAKIDAALKQIADAAETGDNEILAAVEGKCGIVAGRYTGSGENLTKNIDLGFQPVAVLMECQWGTRTAISAGAYGGLAIRGSSVGAGSPTFYITSNGFAVKGVSNRNDMYYLYLAFH